MTKDYIKTFGVKWFIKAKFNSFVIVLFDICPDCGKPRWWKPETHNHCMPF
jgi:hypothetical protein